MSSGAELFEGLSEQVAPVAEQRGGARLRRPERDQIGWHSAAIDDLVAPDHPVRAVWAFVSTMDLRELHDAVTAWAARVRWRGCARSIWPIAGCAAGCR